MKVKLYVPPLASEEESKPGKSVWVGCGSDEIRASPPELFVQVTVVPAAMVMVLGEKALPVIEMSLATAFAVVFVLVVTLVFDPMLVFVTLFVLTLAVLVGVVFVRSNVMLFVFVTAPQALKNKGNIIIKPANQYFFMCAILLRNFGKPRLDILPVNIL